MQEVKKKKKKEKKEKNTIIWNKNSPLLLSFSFFRMIKNKFLRFHFYLLFIEFLSSFYKSYTGKLKILVFSEKKNFPRFPDAKYENPGEYSTSLKRKNDISRAIGKIVNA